MKVQKIDHIGVAVSDLEAAMETFTQLLGIPPRNKETIESQKVEVAVFEIGGSSVELLQGTVADSVISKFVARRGEGLHHVCVEVDDLDSALQRLQDAGMELADAPSEGADGSRVAFVHPRSAHGVLLELVEHPLRTR
jgi:methylmalonyl-CoA/ethylmalonyl-CoA epimerase